METLKSISFLQRICNDFGIKVASYHEAAEVIDALTLTEYCKGIRGIAISFDAKDYIFYDSNEPPWSVRSIIAHELGHVLLGHLSPGVKLSDEYVESQADSFSAAMLALELFHIYANRPEVPCH